jgi:Calcineurin-like phosphoesterase
MRRFGLTLFAISLALAQWARLSGSPTFIPPNFMPSEKQRPGVDTAAPPIELALPLESKSVRFAVIGDSGTGGSKQYEVAEQMVRYHARFPFEFVIMLGDNLYGGAAARDFEKKFERPYKALLDAGVDFHAALGNHDNLNERFYKLFNMGGQRYYAFKKGNVRFFALDSNYMDPQQLDWLKTQLEGTDSAWKICFFHHPLYSDAKAHGPDTDLRALLEPVFEKFGVGVVLSGHEHAYERIEPQHGIAYFVLGNSGQLRVHNLRTSAQTAKGFDTDEAFMLVEITGDRFYFQTLSRNGQTVDSGVVLRPQKKAARFIISRQDSAMKDDRSFALPRPHWNDLRAIGTHALVMGADLPSKSW